MDVKFFYDIPYVKEIIGYFLIPLLIFIIVCSVLLLIYSSKHKDHENLIYKYKMNMASLIISIFLTAVFLAILIGFSYAFKLQMANDGVKSLLGYLVILSPGIPLIALVALVFKVVRLVLNKPQQEVSDTSVIKEDKPLEFISEPLDTLSNKDDNMEVLKVEETPVDEHLEVLSVSENDNSTEDSEEIEML